MKTEPSPEESIDLWVEEIKATVAMIRAAIAQNTDPEILEKLHETDMFVCNTYHTRMMHLEEIRDLPKAKAAHPEKEDSPIPPAKALYQVTALDHFHFYANAGVPTECQDAAQALSVAKSILEGSLAREHEQAKDPTDAAELFDRWDNFGDYPSIYPILDPPFDPIDYARNRAVEMCADLENPIDSTSSVAKW